MTTTSATAPVQMLSMFPRVLLGGGKRAKSGPFALVTQNLLSLGSFPIESLAQSSKADLEGLDLPYVSVDVDADSPSSRPTEPRLMYADTKDDQISSISMHFVAQLHQTCSGAFGNADSLKWEFIEDEGPNRKCLRIMYLSRILSPPIVVPRSLMFYFQSNSLSTSIQENSIY